MRLRNLLSLLENVDLDDLNLTAKQLDTGYSFTGVQAFKKEMDQLESVPAFQGSITTLKESALGSEEKDYLDQRNQAAAEKIRNASQSLYHGVVALLDTLMDVMPTGNKSVLNVLIPEPVNIKKLIYVCGKLEKALQGSIVGEYTKGQAAIQHIDPHADWIEVDVGTEAALCLAADLVWSAAVVYGKYQEAKIFEEHVKALNIKAESLDDIRKGQNEAIVRLIHEESASLVETHLHGNGGQMERLKVPIKLMADLIKDGVKIYPPDDAQDNIKSLFPDFTQLGQIESRAKTATATNPVDKQVEEGKPEEAKEEAGSAAAIPENQAASSEEEPKPIQEMEIKPPVLPPRTSFNDTVDLEV